MKITTFYDNGEDNDYRDNFTLIAENDKQESRRFSVGAGEPEDMFIFRDLNDVLDVPELMKMAYEAGKAGEKFEIIANEGREED